MARSLADPPFVKPIRQLSICTLNVHSFVAPGWEDSIPELIAFITKHRPTVLCLQEYSRTAKPLRSPPDGSSKQVKALINAANKLTGPGPTLLSWLAAILSSIHELPFNPDKCAYAWASVAIIAAVPLHQRDDNAQHGAGRIGPSDRLLGCWVSTACGPLDIVTCHLDHVSERTRLAQAKAYFSRHLDAASAQVWTGDFNALNRTDYTRAEWREVARVRACNSWEPPKEDLMEYVNKSKLTDAFEIVNAKPLPTSRFDTRIDYVLLTPIALEKWQVCGCQTVTEVSFTDHKAVIVTIQQR
eukprot:TRINITY_DN12269_c1_g4_i1.p1 TRINITY_DN12269_c1_g4~~TRINITY_DN12269_c1_g4_i1.p1  ORF type:complete len:300 (+),score=14.42 TRINITY_DN12269_c1_g4_i1:12-911(+)